MSKPEMQPVCNVTKNIVYSGSKADVKLTMIAGNILYEDGRFNIGESLEVIIHEVNKVNQEIGDVR